MATQPFQNSSSLNLGTTLFDQNELDVTPAELEQTLKLSGLLQTSLELDTVLTYFLDAIVHLISFDGAQFTNDELDYNFQYGKNQRHTCTYRLRLASEFLGELTFSRKRRFNNDEIQQIENSLVQLLYPVRNALLYKRAVTASQRDPLTNINNRAAFDLTLEKEIERAHRHHMPLSLCILDLDFFKQINDQHGHSAGDYVLKQLADCVAETLRSSDDLFRFGGEEFAIILTGTDSEGAQNVADRIRREIEEHNFVYEDKVLNITASIGIASTSSHDDAKRLFNKADAALYQAKNAGRNCVHYYAKPRVNMC